MSKRGSPYLRAAIRQAAFVAVLTAKDPQLAKIYEAQVAKGKHFEVALSHVGRKLLHIIFSLLKHQTAYTADQVEWQERKRKRNHLVAEVEGREKREEVGMRA